MYATSATRWPSSREASSSTRWRSIGHSLRSIDYRGGISTFSTITSLGIPTLPRRCSTGWPEMGRLWQAAGTVKSVLEQPVVLEKAVRSGLRSLFVGFETVNSANLQDQRKYQNIGRDYAEAIRRLHDLGVMVNGSFVFGMDHDGPDVFERTVEWAVENGIETATYHILTPYPDTALYRRMDADNRVLHHDWDLFDTRHVVFKPQSLTPQQLEDGYWRAYRDFYRWGAIWRGASSKAGLRSRLRHLAYAGGWKKFEPLWDLLIRSKQVLHALPVLETILTGFGSRPATVRPTGLHSSKAVDARRILEGDPRLSA